MKTGMAPLIPAETSSTTRQIFPDADSFVNVPPVAQRLIFICNIVLVALMLVLACNNRLANDDYCYLLRLHLSHGYWGANIAWWRTWSGHVISTLVMSGLVRSDPHSKVLFAYNVVTFTGFMGALWFLLRQAARTYLHVEARSGQRLQAALLGTGILFFCTVQKDENWVWLMGTMAYLWSIPLLLVAWGLLMPPHPSLRVRIAAALLVAVVPSLNDNMALTMPVTLLAILGWHAWQSRKTGGSPLRAVCTHKAFGPLIAFIISTLIQFSAPGVRLRMRVSHSAMNGHVLLVTAVDMLRVCKHLFVFSPFLLLLGLFGCLIGRCYPALERTVLQQRQTLTQATLIMAGVLLGWMLLTLLPAVAGYNNRSETRTWFPITVVAVGLSFMTGFLLSRHQFSTLGEFRRWQPYLPALTLFILLLCSYAIMRRVLFPYGLPGGKSGYFAGIVLLMTGAIVAARFLTRSSVIVRPGTQSLLTTLLLLFVCCEVGSVGIQQRETSQYDDAYDQRSMALEQLRLAGRTEMLDVQPLPSSGWLMYNLVEPDPNHWCNECIQRGLELPYKIRRAPQSPLR